MVGVTSSGRAESRLSEARVGACMVTVSAVPAYMYMYGQTKTWARSEAASELRV